MDAKAAQSIQFISTTWVNSEKLTLKPSVWNLPFAVGSKKQWRLRVTRSNRDGHGSASLAASCCSSSNDFPASTLESKSFPGFLNEDLILKSKSQDIGPCLNGRCIYLVGMMGSGKTTIGKILSRALDHLFFDSDTMVVNTVNGTSVAEIFKLYGEAFFREKETDALRKLSLMHPLVVSTGGGAVMRPINWKYMQKGISVWLDVPLETLAQRIAAVGTDSRPLLHHDAGDAYMKAFRRLSTLFEERGEAYAKADARVSLESIAFKLGHSDVFGITPTQIAIEALEQIGNFLKDEEGV